MKVICDQGEERKEGLPWALTKIMLEKETAVKVLDRSQENVVLKRTVSWSPLLSRPSTFCKEVNQRFP
jgi:hypothetical protein